MGQWHSTYTPSGLKTNIKSGNALCSARLLDSRVTRSFGALPTRSPGSAYQLHFPDETFRPFTMRKETGE